MIDIEHVISQVPLDWLLEPENPSARYFTLKYILGKTDQEPDVQQAKALIMQTGLVPEILHRQDDDAYRQAYPRFYTNKYKGLVWSLITLAELGAEPNDAIKSQCEFILEHAQEKQDGGFSQSMSKCSGEGLISEVIPCLTGNMVWSLLHFGYLDDPRLQQAIDWINRFMRLNDGLETHPQAPPYNSLEICWGRHTCHMGVVKVLKAFAAIPVKKRSAATKNTISEAAEFILLHHIYKRSHNLQQKAKPGWLRFGFPLMYQTDVLEILDILTALGIRDSRMDDAIQVVLARQEKNGCWKTENSYCSDRLLVPIGQKGQASKFITLRALRVLKRYSSSI